MIEKLLDFVKDKKLLIKGDKILVACSGGVDSMSLAFLLKEAGFEIALAHCNFQLREEDSNLDERLVKDFGTEHEITVYTIRFDTKTSVEEDGKSTQEVARKLRYEWLENKRVEIGYDKIATAHHRNDLVETYLMHMMRGSSYSGFSSIPAINGVIVRPVLFAEKTDLTIFASKHKIPFRADKSNDTSVYTRNRVRNELIPLMNSIKPGFALNVHRQIELFGEINLLVDEFLDQLNLTLVEPVEEGLLIYINELLDMPYKKLWTSRIARDYGFGARRVQEIIDLCYSQTGKEIQSESHRIIRQHQYLMVTPVVSTEIKPVQFDIKSRELLYPLHLQFELLDEVPKTLDLGNNIALFDVQKLDEKLELRLWKDGDKFKPLGLGGSQNISDLLTQNKMRKIKKEQQLVLTSNEEIIWVPGIRMGRVAAISRSTSEVLKIEWLQD
jgi:tRNA(Ile)-lysidine synthase